MLTHKLADFVVYTMPVSLLPPQIRSRVVHFEQDGVIYTPDPETLTLVHHYEAQVGENSGDGQLPVYIIVIVAVAAILSVLSAVVAAVGFRNK